MSPRSPSYQSLGMCAMLLPPHSPFDLQLPKEKFHLEDFIPTGKRMLISKRDESALVQDYH